jgi:hypothetical protein
MSTKASLDAYRENKNLLPLLEIKSRLLGCPANSLFTTLTTLSRPAGWHIINVEANRET